MPQKYGYMANSAVNDSDSFSCDICGAVAAGFTWSDAHGEAMCNKCGTPYQLLQYDEERKRIDAPPKLNVKAEWVPVLKRYWEETQRYTGLGTIMIARDYPECVEGVGLFNEWMDKHPELEPPQ